MNLQDTGFSLVWLVASWLVMLSLLSYATKTAPWHKVEADKEAQHVFLGFAVIQFFIWLFAAEIEGGVTFHFLMTTLATLMFGWQFAMFSALIAVLGISIMGQADWGLFALNWLLMGGIPILIAWALVKWSHRVLDRSFFVFILFNGFFAAALSTLLALSSMALVLFFSGVMSGEDLKYQFIQYFPMMIAPEGFLNGMLLTVLIFLKPEWISTFSDELHLNDK